MPERRRLSLKRLISTIVLLMGFLGLLLALATGELYRRLALQNQHDSLAELIRMKAQDQIADVEQKIISAGLNLQHSSAFQEGFHGRDNEKLLSILNSQFHQYFATAEVFKLQKILVFDPHYALLVQSSEGVPNDSQDPFCPSIVQRAKARRGAEKLKAVSEMCRKKDAAYFVVLIPIGGLRIGGYLLIAVDPIPSLYSIESLLGMPMRISDGYNHAIYASDKWPEPKTIRNMLLTEFTFYAQDAMPVIRITMANDMQRLNLQLQGTRYVVMGIASLTTLVAAFFALMILRKTALRPLTELGEKLRQVVCDKSHLGEPVVIKGNAEIVDLADNFNNMIAELSELYSNLHNMAFTDPLTKLANRALFHERLQHMILMCERQKTHFALLMMDLDRFKDVNDTLGHQVGDHLLQQIAERLEKTVRRSDTLARLSDHMLARLGGDEFAAILPDVADEEQASVVAKRILQVMDQSLPVENHTLAIGVSIGIVIYPQYGDEKNTLLQRADIAMYQAKQNQLGYAFYDRNEDTNSLLQLTMYTELRHAIAENQLSLYFQPKVDMRTGDVCGAEALIRWHHPKRGFLNPDEFIPFAEQTGLIKPLTHQVLKNALQECAYWHRQGNRIVVSVNVSTRSLFDENLLRGIDEALANAGMQAHWLSLEITETTVMSDSHRALSLLTQLDEKRVRLSVDDFGTGYSSLYYLKKLPVDEIKIDRSFVMDMHVDKSDAAIVKSTIDLGHNMGKSVTAEGVEDIYTWNLLVEQGCDFAQGFFIAKPIAELPFRQWLVQNKQFVPSQPAAQAPVPLAN